MVVEDVIKIAEQAGQEIMRYYRSGAWDLTSKADDSPVTQADIAANAILVSGIKAFDSHPIVSEENDPFTVKLAESSDRRFWLIDPLDGTRDFIAHLDTFVICIALVEGNYPIFGLIHAPVTGETWWAEKGRGAFGPEGERLIQMKPETNRKQLIAGASRSETSEKLQGFYDAFNVGEVQKMGSALKFCRLAEGAIDLYPRFGPTYEWDTAAGQIIAEESGCQVIEVSSGERLRYGKDGLKNSGGFIACRGDLAVAERLLEFKRQMKSPLKT